MLREIEALPKVKKVFVRSGIRFDYLLYDKNPAFFRQLVEHHVSGQLKVAPEHCSNHALSMMGKPSIHVYEKFKDKYFAHCQAVGKEQYLVPYLMSSHPGTTLEDAIEMALWLKKEHYNPEQVQDFYPTPGTVSTVMYATGIHPLTGERVYVCRDYHEKQLQRALLQPNVPKNAPLVREALRLCKREDLIGYTADCLVRPDEKTMPRTPKTTTPAGKKPKLGPVRYRGMQTPSADRPVTQNGTKGKKPIPLQPSPSPKAKTPTRKPAKSSIKPSKPFSKPKKK